MDRHAIGTNNALMKVLADAVMKAGGATHGTVSRGLVEKGQQYPDLTQAEIVETRSVREQRMAEVADGFTAMPGGVGAFEELSEMWVDVQFDRHRKAIGVLNVGRYFDRMMAFIDTMIDQDFVPPQHRSMIIVETDPQALFAALKSHVPVTTSKWL